MAQPGKFNVYKKHKIRLIDKYDWIYNGQVEPVQKVFTFGGYTEEQLNDSVFSPFRRRKAMTHRGARGQKKEILTDEGNLFYANGLGRLIYQGTSYSWMIEGYFKDGQPDGFCKWLWNNGQIYTGVLKGFNCNGQGEQVFGDLYNGSMLQEGIYENNVLIKG